MSDKIKINGKDFEPIRLTLGGWSQLEEFRILMDEAISKKDIDKVYRSMCKILDIASNHSNINWDETSWNDIILAYTICVNENKPTYDFPILLSKQESKEKAPWEYRGRSWYFWLNLFAYNYGWTKDIVEKLDIDSAIGLYQEIQIAEQLEHEFSYSMSEVAYPYNPSTKKGEYRPLPRPDWMKPIVHPPKKIKIPQHLLPIGNIVDLNDGYDFTSESPELSNRHEIGNNS